MTEVEVTAEGCVFRLIGEYDEGDPGRISGPPERCYPPEPPSFCIDRVLLQMADGKTYVDLSEFSWLTDPRLEELEELALAKLDEAYTPY